MRGRVLPMPRLITESIKELRREIAKLTEANRKYLVGTKYGSAAADNERRFQRLIEIVDELKSLTDWKKS
jgi:Na+/phosphate symporter